MSANKPYGVPEAQKKFTTAGSAAQSTLLDIPSSSALQTQKSKHPMYALVRDGSGNLTVKYPNQSAVQCNVSKGDYIPGGFESLDSATDTASIVVLCFY